MSSAGNAQVLSQLIDAEGYEYYILLDDDDAGGTTKENLIESGIPEDRIGLVSEFLPDEFESAMIEDCFSDSELAEVFATTHDIDHETFADTFGGTNHFKRRVNAALDELVGTDQIDSRPEEIIKSDMADDIDRRIAHDEWNIETIYDGTIQAFENMIIDITDTLDVPERDS
jgi:hypothetical protein